MLDFSFHVPFPSPDLADRLWGVSPPRRPPLRPPLVTWGQKHLMVLFIQISGQTPGECSGCPCCFRFNAFVHATPFVYWEPKSKPCGRWTRSRAILSSNFAWHLLIRLWSSGIYTFCYQTKAFWGRVCVSGLSAPPGPRHSSHILFPGSAGGASNTTNSDSFQWCMQVLKMPQVVHLSHSLNCRNFILCGTFSEELVAAGLAC